MRMADGDACDVGSLAMSLHTGTHADAPGHFLVEGASIADCGLGAFVGEAVVVDATDSVPVGPHHLSSLGGKYPARILFKTGTSVVRGWHDKFSYVTESTAQEVAAGGGRLVGIDTPSVDSAKSEMHTAHRILAETNVVILENLVLEHVQPGVYDLLALPLKLVGMEASPVRAVLRSRD
jgi:arylformamidase